MREKDLYLAPSTPTVILNHSLDQALGAKGPTDFVSLVSREGLQRMLKLGYDYAKEKDKEGGFASLQGLRKE